MGLALFICSFSCGMMELIQYSINVKLYNYLWILQTQIGFEVLLHFPRFPQHLSSLHFPYHQEFQFPESYLRSLFLCLSKQFYTIVQFKKMCIFFIPFWRLSYFSFPWAWVCCLATRSSAYGVQPVLPHSFSFLYRICKPKIRKQRLTRRSKGKSEGLLHPSSLRRKKRRC